MRWIVSVFNSIFNNCILFFIHFSFSLVLVRFVNYKSFRIIYIYINIYIKTVPDIVILAWSEAALAGYGRDQGVPAAP